MARILSEKQLIVENIKYIVKKVQYIHMYILFTKCNIIYPILYLQTTCMRPIITFCVDIYYLVSERFRESVGHISVYVESRNRTFEFLSLKLILERHKFLTVSPGSCSLRSSFVFKFSNSSIILMKKKSSNKHLLVVLD